MELDVRHSVCGRYEIEIEHFDGTSTVHEFKNIITDIGMMRLHTPVAYSGTMPWITGCRLGTGSAEPDELDVGMSGTYIRTTTILSTQYRNTDTHIGLGLTFRFPLNVVTLPTTFYEIGIDWGVDATNTLFSRALIKNEYGLSVPLSLQPTDILKATYWIEISRMPTQTSFDVNGFDIQIRQMGKQTNGITTSYSTAYSNITSTANPFGLSFWGISQRIIDRDIDVGDIHTSNVTWTSHTSQNEGVATLNREHISRSANELVCKYIIGPSTYHATHLIRHLVIGNYYGIKYLVSFYSTGPDPHVGILKQQGQTNLSLQLTFTFTRE